jgi:hypothetical protein
MKRIPGIVKAAGIIWIVVGAVALMNLAVLLLFTFVLAAGGGNSLPFAGIVVCAGPIIGLIGGVFIHVGIQTVGGKARDTLGNGIGSIILGALDSARVMIYIAKGELLFGLLDSIVAGGLILAGILALVGRHDYLSAVRRKKKRKKSPPVVDY